MGLGGRGGEKGGGGWNACSGLPLDSGRARPEEAVTSLCPPPSVFQLTHSVYKPFIFAAETLSDLSM